MVYSNSLAARVRHELAREKGLEEKKMFGGVGFLLHGNMCVCVWKDFLIARVGPERYEGALAEPHVKEFDVTGRAMKGWVMVEPEGIDNDNELTGWVQRALEFVGTLPRK